jgi:hypothetical protein
VLPAAAGHGRADLRTRGARQVLSLAAAFKFLCRGAMGLERPCRPRGINHERGGVLKKTMALLSVAALVALVAACNPKEYWEYKDSRIKSSAFHLPVDPVGKNLGYERLMINCRYREPLDKFVKENGLPDFINEYNVAARDGIRLYYLEDNMVYDFLEKDFTPDSIHLIDKRPLNSYEKAYIKEIQNRKPF